MSPPWPPSLSRRRPRRPSARASSPGLTLVELLAGLAVLAVLLAAGVPSLDRTLDGAAVAAQARAFCAALRLARAQALRRGGWVTVCAREPAAAAPACAAHVGSGWGAGWLVFADDGTRGALEAGDAVLADQAPLARSGGAEGTLRAFSFGAAGLSVQAAGHVRFLAPHAAAVQVVCVAKGGRPRLAPAGAPDCSGPAS